MIRFRRLTHALLNAWLIDQNLPNTSGRYRLRVWREDHAAFNALLTELRAYFDEAFDDARKRIRAGFEDDLSPFNDPAHDPVANYPAILHPVTLQGYLGEILAVLAVEHWGAHGHNDWIVPAFLFRLHDQEFQHLESINERILAGSAYEPNLVSEKRPGRTGDDALAFRINEKGILTDVMALEAKCLAQNSPEKIANAHEKLASAPLRPSGIRELINLLQEYDTPQANRWKQGLLQFWHSGYKTAARHDGVAYACGHIPARPSGKIAWMPTSAPHPAYTVVRSLEGMEFQFTDLSKVVNTIYRRA